MLGVFPLYGNYVTGPRTGDTPATRTKDICAAFLQVCASTCVIICVITGKIAAAHSPGVPLSASTEANIASMRAWTALFTLFCSSALESSGLVGIRVDKPAYHPPKVELQRDLKLFKQFL